MKKFFLSFFVIASSLIYVLHQRPTVEVTDTLIYKDVATEKFQADLPEFNKEADEEEKSPAVSKTKKVEIVNKPLVEIGVVKRKQTNKPTSSPIITPDKAVQKNVANKEPVSKYKDGKYTGVEINAYYGWVQVAIDIQDGKLTSVDFLKHPDNRSTSEYINGRAMPLLKKEAISAQGVNVSGVSGATYTSRAFKKTLADALTQAEN